MTIKTLINLNKSAIFIKTIEENMMQLDKIIRQIRQNKSTLENYGIKRLGFFGSYVRGEQKNNSDVDILVEFKEGKKSYKSYMELYDTLENLLNKKVDLLTPESISPYIKPYIEKEIIYEKF